jgi:hypothetical protein
MVAIALQAVNQRLEKLPRFQTGDFGSQIMLN